MHLPMEQVLTDTFKMLLSYYNKILTIIIDHCAVPKNVAQTAGISTQPLNQPFFEFVFHK